MTLTNCKSVERHLRRPLGLVCCLSGLAPWLSARTDGLVRLGCVGLEGLFRVYLSSLYVFLLRGLPTLRPLSYTWFVCLLFGHLPLLDFLAWLLGYLAWLLGLSIWLPGLSTWLLGLATWLVYLASWLVYLAYLPSWLGYLVWLLAFWAGLLQSCT